jgi:hypothetical protein
MGSVPDLYTTGDNDPEIEPVQYYRHYLYCDACGSFALDYVSNGLRCRDCASTYAYGTPFFTRLDANPRQLTVSDVPRPLGSSPYVRGAFVEGKSS